VHALLFSNLQPMGPAGSGNNNNRHNLWRHFYAFTTGRTMLEAFCFEAVHACVVSYHCIWSYAKS